MTYNIIWYIAFIQNISNMILFCKIYKFSLFCQILYQYHT